eukprot:1359101-Pyramimonas_sp.AAC.1
MRPRGSGCCRSPSGLGRPHRSAAAFIRPNWHDRKRKRLFPRRLIMVHSRLHGRRCCSVSKESWHHGGNYRVATVSSISDMEDKWIGNGHISNGYRQGDE